MTTSIIINSTQAVVLAQKVLDRWEQENGNNPWIREPADVRYAREVLRSAQGRIRMALRLTGAAQ